MARDIGDNVGDYLQVDAAPATDEPISYFCWVNNGGGTGSRVAIFLGDQHSPWHWHCLYMGNAPTRGSIWHRSGSSPPAYGGGDLELDEDEWGCIHARAVSGNSKYAGTNGTEGAEGTDSEGAINADRVTLGRLGDSTPSYNAAQRLSHACIWDADIGASAFGALARGANPFVTRDSDLVFYAPLHGNESPEPDYAGQNNLTLFGTPGRYVPTPPVEPLENFL